MSSRNQMYELSLHRVMFQSGTPYPCHQQDLDAYNNQPYSHRDASSFFTSRDQAMRTAVAQNNDDHRTPSRDEDDAIARLAAGTDSAFQSCGPDLIIKMFSDLDFVFFGGYLRGKVEVRWLSREEFEHRDGTQDSLGITGRIYPGFCETFLNAYMILRRAERRNPFAEMWSTMLHEMCHAYDLVMVKPDDFDPSDGHDAYFRTVVHAVHRRSQRLFGLEVIHWDEDYMEDHFMSDAWAGEERKGHYTRDRHTRDRHARDHFMSDAWVREEHREHRPHRHR